MFTNGIQRSVVHGSKQFGRLFIGSRNSHRPCFVRTRKQFIAENRELWFQLFFDFLFRNGKLTCKEFFIFHKSKMHIYPIAIRSFERNFEHFYTVIEFYPFAFEHFITFHNLEKYFCIPGRSSKANNGFFARFTFCIFSIHPHIGFYRRTGIFLSVKNKFMLRFNLVSVFILSS